MQIFAMTIQVALYKKDAIRLDQLNNVKINVQDNIKIAIISKGWLACRPTE